MRRTLKNNDNYIFMFVTVKVSSNPGRNSIRQDRHAIYLQVRISVL